MEYLKELNEAQRVATTHIQGPLMVIAGAGSGKTRVLTYRIAHLIDNGVDPFNILALTFTNKAAKEMKERISTIIGNDGGRSIWMGTFHAVFARILRVESEKIGYPSNFTIYDTQDTKSLIRTIVKELGLDDKLYKPGIVYSRISSAKNNLISARAYMDDTGIMADDRSTGRPRLHEVYIEYEKRCFKAHAMDFDDLLFKTNILLKNNPDVLLKYQEKFKYILVDEYQDTNYSQYLIVKRLAARHENICVVGDDAQSIYAFRGANIQNILNFKKDYPDYNLYKLEQNYRSTKIIVDAANSIISNNKNQIKKNVWTANGEGEKIKVLKTYSDNEEGKLISNDIFDVKNNEQALNSDFAILYRTNAQSRSFEESLRKLNIPYRIYGGLSFYQRKEIKDTLAYFRLTANHNDEEALKRVINYPKRGIGSTTIDKARICASENDKSLWDVLENPVQNGLKLNAGTQNKIGEFVNMIKSFATKLSSESAFDLCNEIAVDSGILKEHYTDKTPEGVAKYDNIQELLNGIKGFVETQKTSDEHIVTLPDFLIDVALLTDADNDDPDDKNKVSLMTVHAAKGLEFQYVYVVGMEENLFPSQMAINTRSELEEERRLFYVAITRAEKKATLSFATSRYRWGQLVQCEMSRFIEEIDSKFLNMERVFSRNEEKNEFPFGMPSSNMTGFSSKKGTNASKTKKVTSKITTSSTYNKKNLKRIESIENKEGLEVDVKRIVVGAKVSHERFGKGKVINIEGTPPNVKATVFFPEKGQKQLLLKYAKLNVIG